MHASTSCLVLRAWCHVLCPAFPCWLGLHVIGAACVLCSRGYKGLQGWPTALSFVLSAPLHFVFLALLISWGYFSLLPTHLQCHTHTHYLTHSPIQFHAHTHSLSYPLTYSVTHTHTHYLTHSPTVSCTHTHSLSYPLTYSVTHTHKLTILLTHLQCHAHTHSLSYPLTYSVMHIPHFLIDKCFSCALLLLLFCFLLSRRPQFSRLQAFISSGPLKYLILLLVHAYMRHISTFFFVSLMPSARASQANKHSLFLIEHLSNRISKQ